MTTRGMTFRSMPVARPTRGTWAPRQGGRSLIAAIVLIAASLTTLGYPTTAPIDPSVDALQSYDVRTAGTRHASPTAAQLAALAALPDATVRWGTTQGVPAMVMRYGGTLTGPGTEPVEFLREHAALFGLSSVDLANLEPVREYETTHNGATHIHLRQTDQGRVVYGSLMKLTLDRDGRVVIAGGTFFPGVGVEASPRLSAEEAVIAAAESVGVRQEAPLEELDAASGPAHATVFSNTLTERLASPQPITVELVSFPMPAGQQARLGWKVTLEADSGWYEMVVDAQSAELLHRSNYAAHAPEGNVFTVQNPTLGTQQIVPFTGEAFNNLGWVTDRTTAGNNVNAYQDLNNDDVADYQPQTPPSGDPDYQRFIYTFTDAYVTSGGTDVTTDRDAAITQAFYRVNWLHDYFYALGFDEAAGNFQDDNFGRGGVGGDGMLVEVHNGFTASPEGSNTQSPPDGMRPRMELNVGLVDAAMDADLVTHEYTHGVSNRLLAGQNLPQDEQTWALGEGWSDFFGTSIWDDPIAGEYVCGSPSGCPLFAYDSTPLVYSDLCTLATTPNGCEPHRDGEIWTAPLWDLRTALIDLYGHATGKQLTEQLVIDGIKNTMPIQANFLDARDGILAADVINNGGAHQCLIWRIFAEREMGLSASTSADQETVVPATDVPNSCQPVADAGGPYTTPEGMPVTLDASSSTAGTDPSVGTLSFEWDLDGDGVFDDATGVSATFLTVGDNGVFPIGVRVTNGAGVTDEATTTVNVLNVAPSVNLDPVAATAENTLITLAGVAADPGWLDGLTATIDWDDGSGPQPVAGTLENDAPDATLTLAVTHTYGDDGVYVVEVCGTDDDGGTGCSTVNVTITNVAPTAVIDQDVYLAPAGDPLAVTAASVDPGSDDLTATWNWGDGGSSTTTSLVNPPAHDPPMSPSIQPRNMSWLASHMYAEACTYDLGLTVADDDGAGASDTAVVVITGNADEIRSSGYWLNQYRTKPPNHFTDAELLCYLAIVTQMSNVFDEVTAPLTTRGAAVDVLFLQGNNGSAEQIFDKQLLATWLSFADGSVALDSLVDTDGDGAVDTPFGTTVAGAEAVRLDPTATSAELLAQKDILEHIVTMGG